MTDSISDLLAKKSFDEPPEVALIKKFVQDKFGERVQVSVNTNQIIIIVGGSALAGSLRMYLHELKKLCDTNKDLIIRIG